MSQSYKNMSISRILMLSYGMVIALFVISIGVSLFAVHQNANMTSNFYEHPYQASRSAVAVEGSIDEATAYLEQLLTIESTAEQNRAIEAIEELPAKRVENLAIVSVSSLAGQDILNQFSDANDSLVAFCADIITAVQKGDYTTATDIFNSGYLPQKEVTLRLAAEIVSVSEDMATTFVEDSRSVESTTLLIIGLLGVTAIILVLFMWRRITTAIAVPVREIEQTAKRVASGDLTTHISHGSHNELGSLAASMNETVDSLKSTMQQFSEASHQVARSSAQMSDGAQAVAQGAAEQAIAIEELATNAQRITHVAEENTESVLVASTNSTDVLGAVERTSNQIAHTAQTIQEIKSSAQNISQLANSIEDIAFQTNILALNASVEAARAGESGRGFAIVAEEIRRLASQVSEASRAADELAVDTISRVESGSTMIGTTSESMEEAVASTEGIKEMMSTIAQASKQQLEAIAQIQEGLDSLSEVVQENSAASEESAVIGEELAEQADDLKRLIGKFKLDAEPEQAEK